MKDKQLLTLEKRISILEKKLRIVNEEEKDPLKEAAKYIKDIIDRLTSEVERFSDSLKNSEVSSSKILYSILVNQKIDEFIKKGKELSESLDDSTIDKIIVNAIK